jgi:hypothetical protein
MYKYFLPLLFTVLASTSSAQEIEQFYKSNGGKILSADLFSLTKEDSQLITQLYYPKLSSAAEARLQLVRAWIQISTTKVGNIKLGQLEQIAQKELSLGAYANLLLGDYYWNRTKEEASFDAAAPRYQKALDLVVSSPPHVDEIVERVLQNVAKPIWLKGSAPLAEGAFGNFLSSKSLSTVRPYIQSEDLRSLVDLRIAQSQAREGADLATVCESIQNALKSKKKSELRADAMLLLAQYAGRGCGVETSADEVYRQIIKDFSAANIPAVRRAKAALAVYERGSFSVDVEPAVESFILPQPKMIVVSGPKGKSTQVTISELGVLTDEGLTASRVEISPWLTTSNIIIGNFLAPTKNVSSSMRGPGTYDLYSNLQSGPYLVSGGGEKHYILKTELMLLLAREKDKLYIQSVSLKSGSSIPEVQLEIHRRNPHGLDSQRKTERVKSDVTGLATTINPKKSCLMTEECESEEVVIVGQKFRHTSLIGLNYQKIYWPFEGDPEFWIVPSSTTAKPGDSLSWNLIARPDVFPRFTQSKVQSTLVHPSGAKIALKLTEFDRFGRAAGVTQISPKFSPGTYQIEIKILSKSTGELVRLTFPISVVQ